MLVKRIVKDAPGVLQTCPFAAKAAVANAVMDALSPFGIRHLAMPFPAPQVWRAMPDKEARS